LTNASAAFGSGYLAFTVSKGIVKAAGKLADGTVVSLGSTLLVDSSNRFFTVLYNAPATYKGGCLFGIVEFAAGSPVIVHPLDDVPFVWNNRNPLATAYGDSSARGRGIGLVGGWYDKLGNLTHYYSNMTLTVCLGTNTPPEIVVGSERHDSVCWNPGGQGLTIVTNGLGRLTGVMAPKPGAPMKVGGTWDYSADNVVGLTFGLTRATGIFKGSFNAWFDYGIVHTSKKILFEGVLTPEQAAAGGDIKGRGFYLWSDKSAYTNSLGRLVPYTYKTSYDFVVLPLGSFFEQPTGAN